MEKHFISIDRSVDCCGPYCEPDRYRELLALLDQEKMSVQGAGISYVAASFGGDGPTIGMGHFNRILDFDPENGWVLAEAGISLEKLYNFLSGKGFYFEVQPGHPQISLGGCIAANVQGKNQYREGNFKSRVHELELYHPDHGVLTLSPSQNTKLFDLTCGGLGLTGAILTAKVAVAPISVDSVRITRLRVVSPMAAIKMLEQRKEDSDLLYAWLDLSTFGSRRGSGLIISGRYDTGNTCTRAHGTIRPLTPAGNRFRPPLFGSPAGPWINRAYAYLEGGKAEESISLFDFLFPAASKPFYFDWFGSKGFIEMQSLVPAPSIETYLSELDVILCHFDVAVALTTLKIYGGEQTLLNYEGSGYSFSMDIPRPLNEAMMAKLDELNVRHGAIDNVMKDSRLTAEIVRKQYPEYDSFRERLLAFDSRRRFQSELSKRLEL